MTLVRFWWSRSQPPPAPKSRLPRKAKKPKADKSDDQTPPKTKVRDDSTCTCAFTPAQCPHHRVSLGGPEECFADLYPGLRAAAGKFERKGSANVPVLDMGTDVRDEVDLELESSSATSSECSITPSTESLRVDQPSASRIGLMSWIPKNGVAKWSVRAFCFVQAVHCMTVIFGCDRDPSANTVTPTEDSAAAVAQNSHAAARAGVLFGHTFQLGLLLFALAVVQLGDALLQRIALFAIFETFLGATIGIVVWLPPAGYDGSPWQSALGGAECSMVCLLLGLALLLDCLGGAKEHPSE